MNYKETSQKVIVLIAILLVSLLVIRFQVGNTSKTILVPDDYHTINKAILKSTPGDTVFVKAGIYYENLFVNKTLTIQGENSKNTILIGTGNINRGERAVVTITANHVKIIGFTIKSQNYSSFSNYATGVSVEADNCVITENNISNTFYGIFCSVQSSTIISKNNIISNFKDGIRFCGGSLNNISENNITGNAKGGIAIEGYSNIISKNIITYNNRGIGLGSSYSLVYGNKIGNNNEFNFFFTGSKNIVCSNNISDSTWGIYFSPYFAAPIENKIYNNNFINNRANVGGTTSNNIQCWDNGFPIGGNYWGDYQVRYLWLKRLMSGG
jgi:parallel beta-helix repeat protein